MSPLLIVIRLALVLLAGVSVVQCGDGGGDEDSAAVATASPTPALTPVEPSTGTRTVTPTISFTDGNFFPFSPICTPSPPLPGFAFGRRLR